MGGYRGPGSSISRAFSMVSDLFEDRQSAGRAGEGPEPSPSTALRAGSASKAASSGGLPNASHPSNSGATHPLVQAFLLRLLKAAFWARQPGIGQWSVGSPGRVRGARPGPSQPPEIASDPEGLAITDPSPNPLPREREMWIGRLAPFDHPAGLAMTDPSPPEPRAHAWVQGKHTLSPGRGKWGLDALRPTTTLAGWAAFSEEGRVPGRT